MSKTLFIAVQSGCTEVDGEVLIYRKGVTMVEEGHKLLDLNPGVFEPADQHAHYESTSSEPPAPSRGSRSKSAKEG